MIARRLYRVASLLLGVGVIVAAWPALADSDILPRPAKETPLPGPGFRLAAGSRIVVPVGDAAAADAGRYLSAELAPAIGRALPLAVAAVPRKNDIVIATERSATPGAEAYRLTVDAANIRITAGAGAGLFYGAVSAWDLLTAVSGGRPVPAVAVDDAPRFAWRGIMLDSARHMQSVVYIEKLIDTLALHKFNRFHWHLTDDQGWRIEIPGFPRLTGIGAWRKAVFPDTRDPRTNAAGLYGGFYTQAQIREVVAYAAARHVTIVPEIDLPGHATALLAAYPELGVPGVKPEPVTSDWGLLPEVVNVDEKTLATIERILDRVMDLFPGQYIHLGGDEADKTQWHASPSVQARMKALGIKDEDALERWFIARLARHLAEKGRTLIGWDEIQDGNDAGDLPKDAVVMTWHAGAAAGKALDGGHRMLMAQSPVYYLNNRQQNTADEAPGWTDIITAERIYKNNPVPAGVSDEAAMRVMGVQAQLWTERVRKEAWATSLLFPRAAAVAEVGWTAAARLDWPDFQKRMVTQRARYGMLGLTVGGPSTPVTAAAPLAATRRTSLQLDFCDPQATGLVLEGPEGDAERLRAYNRQPCWIWRAADLSSARMITVTAAALPFNYRLGSKAPVATRPEPSTPGGEIVVRRDAIDGPIVASFPLRDLRFGTERAFRDPLERIGGVHDLYLTVTGQPIDSRMPLDRRAPLIALKDVAIG